MSLQSIHPHLHSYRADVERYFQERSRSVITNKDRHHAAILMSTIFRVAKKEILLFSRKFETAFYERPDVSQAIIAAADRGVNFRIMIQEDANDSSLIERLGDYPRVRIIRCAPEGEAANAEINFTVADETSFRLESDRNTCAAYACANDPEIASRLKVIFEDFERNEDNKNTSSDSGSGALDLSADTMLLSSS